MTQTRKKRLLWAICLLALALFAAAMVWLHHQQLCATGRGEDPYTSDLGQHLYFAQHGMVYSATSLLIGPAYALGGKLGISLLLGVFHLAAVAVFAWGLKAAVPAWCLPVRLLASLIVNLAQAVYIPRGGYWYQGTITGTIYHNTTYIMLAPFALLAVLWFYRAWQGIDGKINLRDWLIYTLLLTAATAFKANLIFAFAPALLVLLIADFIRTRAKNIGNEVLMGCSVFPGVGLCILEATVLFTEEGSGLRLIFTTEFDRHAMLWGVFNEPALLGLVRSLPFVAAVALLLVPSRVLACLLSRLVPLRDEEPTPEQLQKKLLPRALLYAASAAVVYLAAYPILNFVFGTGLLNLGIYLPMLVVEPLLTYRFGRVQETVHKAVSKGVRITVGYALLLLVVGIVREWLSLGTVFGAPVGRWALLPLAKMPAGGFIVLGVLCAVWRALAQKRKAYLTKEARNLVDVHSQKEADREQ